MLTLQTNWFDVCCISALASIITYGVLYKRRAKKPKLYCTEDSQLLNIFSVVFSKPYYPTLWAFFSHGTTIARHLIQKPKHLHYIREECFTPDGCNFIIDTYFKPAPATTVNEKLILILLPGITATSRTPYIEELCATVNELGIKTVVCNHRGSIDYPLTGSRFYSSTDTSYLSSLLDHLNKKYPSAKFIAIGVSLGGMLLTKYLAETGDKSLIRFAMTICMPWDAFSTKQSLEGNLLNKYLYSKKIADNLRNFCLRNYSIISSCGTSQEELLQLKVISDFDRLVVVPSYGYSSIEEYYRDATNTNRVRDIKVSYICLMTQDDPFVPYSSIPFCSFQQNPNTLLAVYYAGGHIGFVEGIIPSSRTYISRVLKNILEIYAESSDD